MIANMCFLMMLSFFHVSDAIRICYNAYLHVLVLVSVQGGYAAKKAVEGAARVESVSAA